MDTKSPWPAATVAQETKLTEQEARHASHLQEIGERVSQLEQERDKEKKRKALEAHFVRFSFVGDGIFTCFQCDFLE